MAVPGVPPLYLVPEGRLFIWPTHAVGQTVPVPGTSQAAASQLNGVCNIVVGLSFPAISTG